MGGVCVRYSRTCRPAGLLFIILAAVPCMLRCSESPAVVVGKMYPRGNHWAVGHLMGKKSVESLPDLREADRDSDDLPPLGTAGVKGRLLEALVQREDRRRTMPQTADGMLQLNSGWREEDRDKYLREMPELLLLALKLRDDDST